MRAHVSTFMQMRADMPKDVQRRDATSSQIALEALEVRRSDRARDAIFDHTYRIATTLAFYRHRRDTRRDLATTFPIKPALIMYARYH